MTTRTAWHLFTILIAALLIAIALLGIPAQAGAASRTRPCIGRIDPSYSNIGLVRIIRKDGSLCVRPATNAPQAPKRVRP